MYQHIQYKVYTWLLASQKDYKKEFRGMSLPSIITIIRHAIEKPTL